MLAMRRKDAMVPTDREDLSRFLVHLTRDYGENEAEDNLLAILREKYIEARNPHCLFHHKFKGFSTTLKDRFNSVCLTEVPLGQLRHLAAEIEGRQIKLKPFGLVFRKDELLLKGASPAIYINARGTALRDHLMAEFRKHFGGRTMYKQLQSDFPNHADSIIAYYSLINTMSDSHDFSWEREWRFPRTLSFEYQDIFAIIAARPKAFRRECKDQLGPSLWKYVRKIPVVSLDWNMERILEEMSVILWNEMPD